MDREVSKKEMCRNLIEELNVSGEIKETLYRIERVASSDNSIMKSSVKDLFIISPSCKELSRISKCYERIITVNSVYSSRGSRTYLELAFPASGKDKDYREFFASPGLMAATQNYFTGVFLISFEQYKGANELIRDEVFNDLIKFINNNKTHISFVFHVTPDFRDAKVLYKELQRYTNICSLEHSFPDKDLAVAFVETQLKKAGIEFSAAGKKEIKKLVEEKIDTSSSSYQGYQTLEKLAANLQFELYASTVQHELKTDTSSYTVGKEDVKMISSSIEIPDESSPYQRKLGFN